MRFVEYALVFLILNFRSFSLSLSFFRWEGFLRFIVLVFFYRKGDSWRKTIVVRLYREEDFVFFEFEFGVFFRVF